MRITHRHGDTVYTNGAEHSEGYLAIFTNMDQAHDAFLTRTTRNLTPTFIHVLCNAATGRLATREAKEMTPLNGFELLGVRHTDESAWYYVT